MNSRLIYVVVLAFVSLPAEAQPTKRLPPLDDLSPFIGTADSPPQRATQESPLPLNSPTSESDVTLEEAKAWWALDSWIRPVVWDGGVEFGLSGTAGNSESVSVRAGANMEQKTDVDEFVWSVTYAKTNSDGLETQNYGILNTRYERFLGESRWSYFFKQQLTYDEFKAFDLRVVLNSGVGYRLLKTETIDWQGRVGAGVSHEIGGPDDSWVPEALFGTDLKWQMSKRQKLTLKCDYFPAWEDFGDYRVDTDFAWEILLNEAYDLHLKSSIIDQYDSTPNGAKPNDVNYAVLLLWKM